LLEEKGILTKPEHEKQIIEKAKINNHIIESLASALVWLLLCRLKISSSLNGMA